ncbi:hypothetical protein BGZ54_008397 [Gamsiella multidivaricata]|nr:hypothetical protein BGZ54_008397 [Gamsiella multidivaricata]
MKRSNDYIQGHDGYKKPRVTQGYNYQAGPGVASMGTTVSEMYGAAYTANPMMMNAYGQLAGVAYGADPSMAMAASFQQYPAASFGAPYNSTQFQMSFPSPMATVPVAIRTIYIGNVPAGATIHEILNFVQTGNIESARLLPEKNCAFISFLDANAALAFHQLAGAKKLQVRDQDLKVGWGKASSVPATVLQAVQQGATRNVFVGSVDENITEDVLMTDFSAYGTVEDIRIMRDKGIAFVHFTHIASAMKAVANLPQETLYSGRRINYGKDRCAKFAVSAPPGAFGYGSSYAAYGVSPVSFSSKFDRQGAGGRTGGMAVGHRQNEGVSMSVLTAEGNRTIYLGSIAPDTTCEDICNVIRGGILSSIKYMEAKHIAFVTFVDPEAARKFYQMASTKGCLVKGRRLKVGWGQNKHTLPVPVIQALSAGATRNVYVGGVEGVADVEKLRKDFSEFGEVEMVNILKEKNCGFVNFVNVLFAVKAVESIVESKPEYAMSRINYGKDRCGNAPRENRNNNGDADDEHKDNTSGANRDGANRDAANGGAADGGAANGGAAHGDDNNEDDTMSLDSSIDGQEI